jgi:hypothetical protein
VAAGNNDKTLVVELLRYGGDADAKAQVDNITCVERCLIEYQVAIPVVRLYGLDVCTASIRTATLTCHWCVALPRQQCVEWLDAMVTPGSEATG